MIEGIPQISVLIVTYKQEELIKRAINSLLTQRDYIYEICVSDDCSPDRTWEVLQEYDKQYPGLFVLNRNEPNVGIFENIERTWSMPTGDIVYRLAGDDECGEGWFKTVVEYILKNKIDYKNENFCIYGDFKADYPNGDSILFKQDAIKNFPHDALSLAIRGIICGRGCCYSSKLLNKFEKVSQGRSHIAEMAQDRQLQCFSENNYYIHYLANIYHTCIGVSVVHNDSIQKERRQILSYALDFFEKRNIKIKPRDIKHGEFIRAVIEFKGNRTPYRFLKIVYYFFVSLDIRYFFLGNDIRHLIFAVIRRFPHKNPIHF